MCVSDCITGYLHTKCTTRIAIPHHPLSPVLPPTHLLPFLVIAFLGESLTDTFMLSPVHSFFSHTVMSMSPHYHPSAQRKTGSFVLALQQESSYFHAFDSAEFNVSNRHIILCPPLDTSIPHTITESFLCLLFLEKASQICSCRRVRRFFCQAVISVSAILSCPSILPHTVTGSSSYRMIAKCMLARISFVELSGPFNS